MNAFLRPALRGITAVFMLWTLLGLGCGEVQPEGPPAEVEEFKFSQVPGGARILTGTLYNPGDRPIRNSIIQVSLFDDRNQLLTTMNIEVSDVPPGNRKPFREPIDTDLQVTRAKVRRTLTQYRPI